ncbi:uncharacterized protein LOC135348688 [Halichondria panicea]|uniref:uncharacterized protein LOC135348688 n=1 Tax=Halichondria panicea TaxID=6063 RepID=UPI00312BA243
MATGVSSVDEPFKPGKEEGVQPSAPMRDEGPPLYHEAPPDYFASVAEQPPPTSYPPPNMSHMASVSGQPFFSAPQPSQQFIPTPGMAPPFLPPPMLQNPQDTEPPHPGPHTFEPAAILLMVFAAFTICLTYAFSILCAAPALHFAQRSKNIQKKTKDFPRAQKKANYALVFVVIGGLIISSLWITLILGLVVGVSTRPCLSLSYSTSERSYVCRT